MLQNDHNSDIEDKASGRMGPMSRPLTRTGQWSQTTTFISQPAARLKGYS